MKINLDDGTVKWVLFAKWDGEWHFEGFTDSLTELERFILDVVADNGEGSARVYALTQVDLKETQESVSPAAMDYLARKAAPDPEIRGGPVLKQRYGTPNVDLDEPIHPEWTI